MRNILYYFIILIFLILFALGLWQKAITMLLILLCLKIGVRGQNYFNPFLLIIIPLTSFLVYYSKLGPEFLSNLQSKTNTLIILCFSAIILGFTVIKNLKLKPIKAPKSYNENFFIICLLGLFPTVLSYMLYGSVLDATGDEIMDIKSKQSIPIIGQFAYFLPASILIACKNNNTKQIIIAITLSFIASLMTLTKTAMVIALLFTIIGLSAFKPDILSNKIIQYIKRYIIILLPALVIILFYYNNSVRSRADSASSIDYIERGGGHLIQNDNEFTQNMFLNYLYFCSPWSNLDYNIQNNHTKACGKNTFAQFGDKIGISVEKVEKLQPSFFNTHSFITDFYIDFGYLGAIIASFILGCIIYFFYSKFYFSGDSLLIAYYCLIGYATIMLFFSNHFVNGYLLNYLITFGGYYFVMHNINLRKI